MKKSVIIKLVLSVGLLLFISKAASQNAEDEFNPYIDSKNSSPRHEQLECTVCHALVAEMDATGFSIFEKSDSCLVCHKWSTLQRTNLRSGFHDDIDRSCTDCHLFHNTQYLISDSLQFAFDYKNPDRRFQCLSCHFSQQDCRNLSEGHILAKYYFHSNAANTSVSPTEACLTCHSPGGTSPDLYSAESQPPDIIAVSSHPVGVSMVTSNTGSNMPVLLKDDPRIKLNKGVIECITCHSLVTGENLLADGFVDEKDLCLSCHSEAVL
jgi:predicted CXXCH cytochrome family protein